MDNAFKHRMRVEKKSLPTEILAIGIILIVVVLVLSYMGIRKQEQALESLADLSGNMTSLTDKFNGAVSLLEARQEEARRSTEAVQNGLDTLSMAIGEMTDALRAQKAVSSDLAKAKRGSVVRVPKTTTEKDIERLRKALQ